MTATANNKEINPAGVIAVGTTFAWGRHHFIALFSVGGQRDTSWKHVGPQFFAKSPKFTLCGEYHLHSAGSIIFDQQLDLNIVLTYLTAAKGLIMHGTGFEH